MCFSWLSHSPIHVLLSTPTPLQHLPPTPTQVATTTHLQTIGIVKLHHHRCGCRHRHPPRFISFLRRLLALLIFSQVTGLWGRTQNTLLHQGFGYFDLASHYHCVLRRAQVDENASCCNSIFHSRLLSLLLFLKNILLLSCNLCVVNAIFKKESQNVCHFIFSVSIFDILVLILLFSFFFPC